MFNFFVDMHKQLKGRENNPAVIKMVYLLYQNILCYKHRTSQEERKSEKDTHSEEEINPQEE